MLGLQLLKAFQSSEAFYEAMTTKFSDLCGDFECLQPLNTKLLQSKVKVIIMLLLHCNIIQETQTIAAVKRQHIFPFVMMSHGVSFEQKYYAEISKVLMDLYKSPTKIRTTALLRIADRW